MSSAPATAHRVLDLVVPVCAQRSVDFKVAGDPAMHYYLNSKRHPRGGSGKFMTLYPSDEELFKELLEELYQRTRDEDLGGVRVLSDRQYKDSSLLFYRYGGFISPRTVNPDGVHTLNLVSPTGELVPDERLPYFQLPEWVSDPFGRAVAAAEPGEVTLDDRFRIDEALTFSNAGGVYRATDLVTGSEVLVKEARSLSNCFRVGDRTWDAVFLLEREYELLRLLAPLPFVPDPLALIEEADHTFLVEELVEGVTLRTLFARNDFILAPYLHRPERVAAWAPRFRRVAAELIRMVEAVHERGVLLGDLSLDNVMVDPETLALALIDFESAVTERDDPEVARYATMWGTPGFVHPDRATRERLLPSDDLFAAGMVLYACLAPVNPLFVLDGGAAARFLDHFVAMGVPEQVRHVITALQLGDAARASKVLAAWDP